MQMLAYPHHENPVGVAHEPVFQLTCVTVPSPSIEISSPRNFGSGSLYSLTLLFPLSKIFGATPSWYSSIAVSSLSLSIGDGLLSSHTAQPSTNNHCGSMLLHSSITYYCNHYKPDSFQSKVPYGTYSITYNTFTSSISTRQLGFVVVLFALQTAVWQGTCDVIDDPCKTWRAKMLCGRQKLFCSRLWQ